MSVITDLIDENSSCHARIAELEARIVWLECELQVNAAPVSKDKAQDFDPLVCDYCNAETQDPWHGSGMLNGAESRHIHACSQCRNLLPTTKAQGVVMPDVNAAAKALCNRHAMICGVDADDQWQEYSQDFIADAETVLANARLNAAPVQQVSVPDERGAFEREAVERYGYTWASIYSRRQGLGYSDSSLCMAWIMWQARAMLSAAPSPAGVDGLEVVARLLSWRGNKHQPIPHDGAAARTFVEYPENYYPEWPWAEGEGLCRLSDAKAIIDGLRGELEAAGEILAQQGRRNTELRKMRDQHAQRIGELEGLLRHAQKQVPTGSGLHMRIDAALSAVCAAAPNIATTSEHNGS